MEYKDYYKILGVTRDAGEAAIKQAYRRRARKYHPDVSQEKDAEQRFKEIGEAYEVLKDAQKRQSYDQLGADWKAGQEFRPPPGWQQAGFGGFGGHAGNFSSAGGFSDFFESLFGGGFAHSATGQAAFRQNGQDQNAAIDVSISEAFHGASKTIRLSQGKSLQVKIPQGITSGKKIRLSGQGGSGVNGGASGDLYLQVNVLNDSNYELQGKDIYHQVRIAPWEAALGEKIPVMTLSGAVEIKIPAGSQGGRKMRLTGKGLPGNPPGDFYVCLNIAVPAANSEEEKSLYQQMKNTFQFDPRA